MWDRGKESFWIGFVKVIKINEGVEMIKKGLVSELGGMDFVVLGKFKKRVSF